MLPIIRTGPALIAGLVPTGCSEMALDLPPFDATSAWNAAIPAGAAYQPAAGVAGRVVGLSTWLDPDWDSLPIYHASKADRPVPILYVAEAWAKVASGSWLRSDNPPAVEAEIKAKARPAFPTAGNSYSSQDPWQWVLAGDFEHIVNPTVGPAMVRAPAQAVPAPGWDGHLAVYQPNGDVLEVYGGIRLSTGELVALNYHRGSSAGHGDGAQNGITASMLPVYAGVITDADVARNSIDHAMKLVVPADLLAPAYVYPAMAFDRGALSESPPYSGTLPMGARLAVPRTVVIANLGLRTRQGWMIAEAAQSHGFIIADRGGAGITICVERAVRDPLLDRWNGYLDADLQKIMGNLRYVPPI